MKGIPITHKRDSEMLDPIPRSDRAMAKSDFGSHNEVDLDLLTMTRIHRNATESLLLRLPPELRNRIYSYAIGGHYIELMGSRDMRLHTEHEFSDADNQYHMLGLLRTCRQIYAETRLIPFTCNVFSCGDTLSAFNWVRAMPTQMQAIRAWRLSWTVSGFYMHYDLSVYMISMSHKRKQSYIILQLFSGVTKVEVRLPNDGFEETSSRAKEEGISRDSFARKFPQTKFTYRYLD